MRIVLCKVVPLPLLTLALAVLITGCGKSGAKPSQSADSPRPDPVPGVNGMSTLPAEEKPTEILQTGQIASLANNRLRLRAGGDQPEIPEALVFRLTDQTKVFVGGQPASIADLKEGALVAVTAEQDGGAPIALRIDVAPTPM